MNASETSPSVKGETQNKCQLIIQYKVNNPEMKASEIAHKARTTPGYVYNVLSNYKKRIRVERWGSGRSNGLVGHGLSFYEDAVPSAWYGELAAPVVNFRTGMKQVGFKGNGDPCSCQLHRNGRVIIFPHALGWQDWLIKRLVSCGWSRDMSELLVMNCRLTVKVVEACVKVPEGYLPEHLLLKTAWGFVLVKDDSPRKNTLEIKLSVPDLERYLGLPEIKKKLDLLVQGGPTTNQLLRAAVALLLQLRNGGQKER
ncbi:MAG: hypothetical protein QMD23_02580 [Candidatus Bathyarchaeia archaeon]|nr:hypothetical protein [Candidatus Bathyarchaeia archaeon]